MKTFPIYLLFLILLVSCKKTGYTKKADPGPFYISFKLNDSPVDYRAGADYVFQQVRGTGTGAGNGQYFPETWISPVNQPYSNVVEYYSFGFSFSYMPTCQWCAGDWVAFGDSLFTTGRRKYCYTGINYVAQPIGLTCSDNHGITLFFNSTGGNLFNSGSGAQPDSSFYVIDTVTNFHSRDTTISCGNYDKIISGRFSCRMFNPLDIAGYQVITEGKFRMPIWLNDPY